MQFARFAVYSIYYDIMEALHPNTRKHLLTAHAITGCDTVSALFKVGKKKALKVLEQYDWQALDSFKNVDATHDEIASAGESFLLKLYKGDDTSPDLDRLRFVLYMQKMKKSDCNFEL